MVQFLTAVGSSDSNASISYLPDYIRKGQTTSSTKFMDTCKHECPLSPESTLTDTHTNIQSPSHCSSRYSWLSSLVQVGHLESGGRLNLSTLLIIIVWQQTYRVKHNFTSSQMPQQGLIDPAWHHGGRWNGEVKMQSSADLAPDWGPIATGVDSAGLMCVTRR